MASWAICPCGHRIGTGSFPNPGVHRLISEAAYDEVVDPVNRSKLNRLVLASREVVECPACSRLLVRKADGEGYRAYSPEAPPDAT